MICSLACIFHKFPLFLWLSTCVWCTCVFRNAVMVHVHIPATPFSLSCGCFYICLFDVGVIVGLHTHWVLTLGIYSGPHTWLASILSIEPSLQILLCLLLSSEKTAVFALFTMVIDITPVDIVQWMNGWLSISWVSKSTLSCLGQHGYSILAHLQSVTYSVDIVT